MTEEDRLEIRAIVREECALALQRLGMALCVPVPAAPTIAVPADIDEAIALVSRETDLGRLEQIADAEQQGEARPGLLDVIAWRRTELTSQAPA